MGQEVARIFHTGLIEKRDKGIAGVLFKPPAKRLRGHIREVGHLGNRQLLVEVLQDIVIDLSKLVNLLLLIVIVDIVISSQ